MSKHRARCHATMKLDAFTYETCCAYPCSGIETGSEDSPKACASNVQTARAKADDLRRGTLIPAAPRHAAPAADSCAGASGSCGSGARTWGSCSSAILSDNSATNAATAATVTAATATASPCPHELRSAILAAAATRSPSDGGCSTGSAAAALAATHRRATGAAAAAPVGFGSTFSTSPAAGLVEPAARAAAAAAATGTPLYGHVAEEDGEDCQLRVVPVVDQDTTCRGGQPKLGKGPKAVTFAAAASAAGKQAGSAGHVVGKAATEEERIPLLQASSDGDSGGGGGGHNGHSGHHGHHRRVGLFQRYAHELAQGWPVLAPVTLLLFANISVQVGVRRQNVVLSLRLNTKHGRQSFLTWRRTGNVWVHVSKASCPRLHPVGR